MTRKFAFYERYGVEEYYIYDPDTGAMDGHLRRGGVLEKIPQMAGFVSPRLGIRFEPGDGPDNLRIIRPDGERFKTFQEVDAERNELAQQRDVVARQRDEAARQRDEAARREGRLAAKLRELGIDPDAIEA